MTQGGRCHPSGLGGKKDMQPAQGLPAPGTVSHECCTALNICAASGHKMLFKQPPFPQTGTKGSVLLQAKRRS